MRVFILLVLVACALALPNRNNAIVGGRIIGGSAANSGQFPFIAAIYKTTAQGTYFCSGTLLSTLWVLTGGQCVHEGISFQIRLGSNALQAADSNRLTVVSSTYYHPDNFDPVTLQNDVGLIKFHLPISFSDYIKPVDYLGGASVATGVPVLTLGWGQIGDHIPGLSSDLNYVTLSTLSNEECRFFFGAQLADHMLCAAGNFNEGVCNGDSGSPLILYGIGSRVFQVGISTFISGNGCESTDPSGFTRIDEYTDWILDIMNNR